MKIQTRIRSFCYRTKSLNSSSPPAKSSTSASNVSKVTSALSTMRRRNGVSSVTHVSSALAVLRKLVLSTFQRKNVLSARHIAWKHSTRKTRLSLVVPRHAPLAYFVIQRCGRQSSTFSLSSRGRRLPKRLKKT